MIRVNYVVYCIFVRSQRHQYDLLRITYTRRLNSSVIRVVQIYADERVWTSIDIHSGSKMIVHDNIHFIVCFND